MSSSSPQPPSSSGAKKGETTRRGGGEIESLAGLWSDKVCEDARALRSSFGKKAALDFLVEETKNVEQVVAGGVHELLLDLYEADAWGAASGRAAVCAARRAVLSQADVDLTRAKRQLLPGLAEECGCFEGYLAAVAAYGRESPRLRKRRRKKNREGGEGGSEDLDENENDDEAAPDARLADAELRLVSLLADARRDLDLASSDAQRRVSLRVARREAGELVSRAVSGSSRLWGGVVLGMEREKREQRQGQVGGSGGGSAPNVGGVAGWRRTPSQSSIPASSSSPSSLPPPSSRAAAVEGSWNYTPATTPRASTSSSSSSSSPSSSPFSPRPPLPAAAAASRSIFSRPTSPPSPSLPASSVFSRSSAPAPLIGIGSGIGSGSASRPAAAAAAAFAFSDPSAALPQGFDPAAPLGGSDVVALFERGRAAADRRLEAAAVEAAGGPGPRADELVRALYADDDADFDADEDDESEEEKEKVPTAAAAAAAAAAAPSNPLTPPPLPRVSVGPSSPSLSLAAAMPSKLDVAATEPFRPGAFREEREGEGGEGGGEGEGEEGEPL